MWQCFRDMFKKIFYLHYPCIFMEECYKIVYVHLYIHLKELSPVSIKLEFYSIWNSTVALFNWLQSSSLGVHEIFDGVLRSKKYDT